MGGDFGDFLYMAPENVLTTGEAKKILKEFLDGHGLELKGGTGYTGYRRGP